MKKRLKILLCILGIIIGVIVLVFLITNGKYLLQKSNFKEEKLLVQGNHSRYVPQGLTYDSTHNIVIQTSYQKDHKVSKVFVSDFDSGKVLHTYSLYDQDNHPIVGHVGGIATDSKTVWITSDNTVWEFFIDDFLKDSKKIYSIREEKLPIRGDFCTYYQNELWIGDFYQPIFWKVKNNTPLLFTYDVNDEIDYNNPNKITSLPKTIQGMAITNDSIYFTHSYTFLNPSKLSIYHNIYNGNTTDSYSFNGKKIPYYHFLSNSLEKTTSLSPMAEGIFYKEHKLYLLFESSSDAYPLAFPKIKNILSYKVK